MKDLPNIINGMLVYNLSLGEEEVLKDSINILSASKWRCIDGRYEEAGRLSVPGGVLGIVMVFVSAFKSIGFTDGDILRKIQSVIESYMGGISFHSDTHSEGECLACAGCGHVMLGYRNHTEYGLPEYWLSDISLDLTVRDVLSGEHQEKGVIIFEGDIAVPLPSGNIMEDSYFVYHKGAALKLIKYLSDKLSEEFNFNDNEVLFEIAKRTLNLHVDLTVKSLASNLPVYKF